MPPSNKKLEVYAVAGGLIGGALAYVYWAPYLGFTDMLPRVLIGSPYVIIGLFGGGFGGVDIEAGAAVFAILAGGVALGQYIANALLAPYVPQQLTRAVLMGPAMSLLAQFM